MPRWMLIGIGALALLLVLAVALALQPGTVATPQPVARVVPPVDPQVYRPFTREGAPMLYALWGEEMMGKINALKRPAAELIARDPRCDTPQYTDLDRSSTPVRVVLLVTCRNQWSTRIEDWRVQGGVQPNAPKAPEAAP